MPSPAPSTAPGRCWNTYASQISSRMMWLRSSGSCTGPGGAGPRTRPPALSGVRELLLRFVDAVDLNPARLHALLERQREFEQAVTVGRGDPIQIQELRHGHRLLVVGFAVVAAAALLGADRDRAAGDLNRHLARVDARHWNLEPPVVVARMHLEGSRGCGAGGTRRQVAPELIEQPVGLALE